MVPAKSAFAACLIAGTVDLLAINLELGPRVLTPAAIAPPATSVARPAREPPPPSSSPSSAPAIPASEPLDAAVEQPTEIVARFEHEQSDADLENVRKLAVRLRDDPTAEIVVEGHSDASGNEYKNLSLSLDRAHWVRDRLGELGINKLRVKAVGLGSARPLIASDPQSPANRRVEVRWVSSSRTDGG